MRRTRVSSSDILVRKISFNILNFDKLFRETPDATLIPCVLKSAGSKTMNDHIQDMFMKSKELTFAASCDCGKHVGNFFLGTTCPSCKTVVRKNFANKLNYKNWLEIPEPLPPILHPGVFQVLVKWLGRTQQGHLLKLLMATDNRLPDKMRGILGTGMSYFYHNFENIIRWLAENYRPVTTGKRSTKQTSSTEEVLQVLEKFKDCLFIRHIPILSNTFHLVEEAGTLAYVDDASGPILKAKLELTNAIYILNSCPNNQQVLDRHMYEFYMSYLEYIEKIAYTKLMKKKGFIRKRNMGARVHNSFRTVVVPIVEEHDCDEIHIPWKVGVTNLKMEIINFLQQRRGMPMEEILTQYHRALVNYDPLIDEVMCALIKECPFKGLPVFFGRNPSLRLGAIQALWATKIKKDPADHTTGISVMIVAAPNCDFDGDACWQQVMKEMGLVPHIFRNLHPMVTMLCSSGGLSLSGDVKISDQCVVAMHTWISEDPDVQNFKMPA